VDKRKLYLPLLTLFIIVTLSIPGTAYADPDKSKKNDLREVALNGPSIQVDPWWPYYRDRSPESIAEEIELAGYKNVHYLVVDDMNIKREIIDAFHARGITVWAMTYAEGAYPTDRLPADWPEWEMEFIKPVNDGYRHFSPFSTGYRKWKKEYMAKLVTDYPFDGIEIVEFGYPDWFNFERGYYGDVGPLAQEAFRKKYNKDIPDFTDASSPNYYLTNKKLYLQWVDFRVETMNDFADEIYNGKGGVRDVRPDVLVATWTLATSTDPSGELTREFGGQDAGELAKRVRPDIHFFQTNWPDWIRPELEPDYPVLYEEYLKQFRKLNKRIPVGIQADIGSLEDMRRSHEWISIFGDTAFQEGYNTWTAYEYFMGEYMYTDKPTPLQAVRMEDGAIAVSFNKRIDPTSVSVSGRNFDLVVDGESKPLTLQNVKVDGNRILLYSHDFTETTFDIAVHQVKDTPELWLFKGFPANESPEGAKVTYTPNNLTAVVDNRIIAPGNKVRVEVKYFNNTDKMVNGEFAVQTEAPLLSTPNSIPIHKLESGESITAIFDIDIPQGAVSGEKKLDIVLKKNKKITKSARTIITVLGSVEAVTASGYGTYMNVQWQPLGSGNLEYEIYGSKTKDFIPDSGTLLGTTSSSSFMHAGLSINETWHYKVRASDGNNQYGSFSQEVAATTGNRLTYEAEEMIPPVEATALVVTQLDCCNVQWSKGKQILMYASHMGDHMTLEFDVPIAGTWNLDVLLTKAPDFGIYQLSVDGINAGLPFDLFNPAGVSIIRQAFGALELTAGKHTITFTLVDKHPNASNYLIGLDQFILEFVGASSGGELTE